ncbi:hypothetical protein FHG87_005208 [Trinorchestia longiramus]|nr:hypothetical protein FHG87_005208 [Trinorchestia longiramus]
MPELQAITSTLSHDIIAFNETWLDLNGRYLSAEISLKGYFLQNVDKPSHNRGGGFFYLHQRKVATCSSRNTNQRKLQFAHIKWTTRQSQAPGTKLIELVNTNSLQQHVNEPTRRNDILNLVMTTTDLSINDLEVTEKIGDHQKIDFTFEIQDPNTRTQHKQVLDYKRANFELMKEELGSRNYEVLMSNKNAEECYMILKEKIATATEHHILRKRIRPTNNPPWFPQEIKRLINVRQQSYRRLKRYQIELHRQEHIYACRAVKRTIKSTNRPKWKRMEYEATTPDGYKTGSLVALNVW